MALTSKCLGGSPSPHPSEVDHASIPQRPRCLGDRRRRHFPGPEPVAGKSGHQLHLLRHGGLLYGTHMLRPSRRNLQGRMLEG